jgi:hypothetical protein
MKIITTLIYIIGLQYISFANAGAPIIPQASGTKASVVFYVSSPASESLRAKYTSSMEAKDLVITAIPAVKKVLTSANIELDMLGTFTFKRDGALFIPDNQEVFIEDKVNGKIFNLRTFATYTFKVERYVPGRFVLHILDKSSVEEIAFNK